jgi:general secretion pathway protein G
MKNNRGFTLIELLVVIAIIGILSSVVLASLNSARTKSRDAKRLSDIKQLQLALELAFDSGNTYPTQATAAVPPVSLSSDGWISSVPLDPQSPTRNYLYQSADGSTYCLGADLEDDSHSAIPASLPCTVGSQDYAVSP